MQFSQVTLVRFAAAFALIAALSVPASAQTPAPAQPEAALPQSPQPQRFELENYSRGRSYFPNFFAPYEARHVPPINLTNSARLDQLLHDGKLMLSMDDAVALALEDNLDIAIARYNLNISDTDVLRAKSGSNILGTPLGIVQNTPGGEINTIPSSTGSGPGGTTTSGTGGAGAGLGGLVSSTLGAGPPITSFDPLISGTLQSDHSTNQCLNFFCGTQQNTGTENFSYVQGFPTGTNILVGFNNNRIFTNNPITTISPSLASNFRFTLTQHLLQGFGLAPNTRFIRIAKNNREISDVTFRLQVTSTVHQIEYMYWDLVFAYENVRVQRESLTFAQKTLSDTKKQVEIGTMAPIEIVRAQSTVATDQQGLTQAETSLQLQQLLMKNALSRNLQDPSLADAEVVPTSTMNLPEHEEVVPTQDLINDALAHRPELAEAHINLSNARISNKAIVSSLRPTLDAFAYYGGSGLGGAQNAANTCNPNLPAAQQPFCNSPGTIGSTSYLGTLQQLVNSTAPDKGIGVTLNIPILNRAAQSEQVRSELEYRQSELQLQQLENQIRIQVRNAQFAVQQNRAAVEASQAAVALARQSLDAEQKKYALGASTSTLVLQNQSAMATAESTLVAAMANYVKARADLDQSTGLLLERSGIILADALHAQVSHMPNIPYVAPRQDLSPQGVPQQPATPQTANPAPQPQTQTQPQ
jgi:outer membrane protein